MVVFDEGHAGKKIRPSDTVLMKSRWESYWNRAPLVRHRNAFRQVGKTVRARPFSLYQFRAIVQEIKDALALDPKDAVLDLCCGNGLVTQSIAQHCKFVIGIDFSAPLIVAAEQRFNRANIAYVQANATDFCSRPPSTSLQKIYMYEALQHLSLEELRLVLRGLGEWPVRPEVIFFGSIPDATRLRVFYNTESRWKEYISRVRNGTEAIGHWWHPKELSDELQKTGYAVELRKQNRVLPGSHYRFDAILRSRGS